MSVKTQSTNPGVSLAGGGALAEPRSDATVAASIVSHENIGGTISSATMPQRISRARNVTSVRTPVARTNVMSRDEATPVMSSDTTSGTTVMRIAFTQSVPMGSTKLTRERSAGAG